MTSRSNALVGERLKSLFGEDSNMARRRLQQRGDLYQQGGWWKLRWREDQLDDTATLKRGWSKPAWIGPCEGAGKLTEKQAQRIAWENFLSRLDQNNRVPQSVMTVQDFVDRKFIPEHVDELKKAGQIHYETMLRLVLPAIGKLRLRDVTGDDIQKLVSTIRRTKYPVLGKKDKSTGERIVKCYRTYSAQTCKHARNVVSAIFRHAKEKGWYQGENPAAMVRFREIERVRERHALTLEQARQVLSALPKPCTDIALCAVLTSMNIAEITGLRWECVNLGSEWITIDGDAIPPHTIAVRAHWYRNEFTSLKTTNRKRDLPIPAALETVLVQYKTEATQPTDYVFASSTGKPVDVHNEFNRRLKPIGKQLGMPWLSWHVFRRTSTTLAKQLGMDLSDRIASMGHADARMTMTYTVESLDRRRKTLDLMAEELTKAEGGMLQ